ncbi:hypothetical protein BC830DRAFT_620306 [Chytriomyces sp. MP71]|nr:hypothetical protein BC830DRAFT_620306 [Chytriomyces sp. MP71]
MRRKVNHQKLEHVCMCLRKMQRSFGGSYAQDIMSEMKHEELLSVCNQTKPVTFEAALRNYTLERKLGEATFSEVFSFTNESNFRLAVKLMPFGAPKDKYLVNGSPQISVHEVTQEVLITKTMSDFRNHGSTGEDAAGFNFVELVSVHVCQGFYPQELLAAWDDYAQDKDSENDRPDYFPKKQLYAVIVLMNGGTDLEHFKIKPVATAANVLTPLKKSFGVNTKASSAATNKTWAMVRSILTQTILSLAAAERKLKFEHRDLHWGNVLCMAGPQYLYAKTSYFCGEDLGSIQVPLEGVKVTIIDYTLSRCEHGDRLYFNKMDDESFFTGEGDYQFDIYRMMREETDGAWDAFFPKTNLMWIGYLLYKLLKAKSLPHAGSVAKQSRLALAAFRERINGYSDMSALVRVEVALSGGDATKLFFS